MPDVNSQNPQAYSDSTQKSTVEGEPFSTSTKRNVESCKMSGQTISSDSRDLPLAGSEAKIERNQNRNNEHIKYDDSDRYTAGG